MQNHLKLQTLKKIRLIIKEIKDITCYQQWLIPPTTRSPLSLQSEMTARMINFCQTWEQISKEIMRRVLDKFHRRTISNFLSHPNSLSRRRKFWVSSKLVKSFNTLTSKDTKRFYSQVLLRYSEHAVWCDLSVRFNNKVFWMRQFILRQVIST